MNNKRISELLEINKKSNPGDMLRGFDFEYIENTKILYIDNETLKYVSNIETQQLFKISSISNNQGSSTISISYKEFEMLKSLDERFILGEENDNF